MTIDEIALLNMAVLHADWGTQMKREPLRKCIEIIERCYNEEIEREMAENDKAMPSLQRTT